jgi:hypothetical protein
MRIMGEHDYKRCGRDERLLAITSPKRCLMSDPPRAGWQAGGEPPGLKGMARLKQSASSTVGGVAGKKTPGEGPQYLLLQRGPSVAPSPERSSSEDTQLGDQRREMTCCLSPLPGMCTPFIL